MSLREAGDILNIHHSVLGKIEQGSRKMEISEFVQYCHAIGADPHEGIDVLIKSNQSLALL